MEKSNRKILFVISAAEQYRNYISTSALAKINRQILFLVHPQLADRGFGVPPEKVMDYGYPGSKEVFHRHIFNINCWKHRYKSPSFLVRLLKLKPRQLFIYRILSIPPLYQICKFIFLKYAYDECLFKIVKKADPSAILIPSNAYDGLAFELIKIAKILKIPSFLLIDNWDNLSGKTIFTLLPDYLGVWSRQCAEHAVNIRGMPGEKIFILGAPRFMEYMKKSIGPLSSPYPFRYILFAGSSFQYDELGALKKIDEAIDRRKLDLKVIFRPALSQKKRNCPDVFFEYDFKHTVLDIPARLYYKREAGTKIKDGFSPVYTPTLDYYPKLLSNMEFMICPLSTMILEGTMFNKKVFALAYPDDLHLYNLNYLWHHYIHFKDIDRLPNVRMVFNFEDLDKIFEEPEALKVSGEPIDLDYFISKKATIDYPANLKGAVDKIMLEWRPG